MVVVEFNSGGMLFDCLESLKKFSGDGLGEIIVVDNGGRVEEIAKSFPGVKYINPGGNPGFGVSANMGAEIASGNLLLFINPDAKVIRGSTGETADLFSANPEVAVIGALIQSPSGDYEPASARNLPRLVPAVSHLMGLDRIFPNNKWFSYYHPIRETDHEPLEVEAVSGAGFFIRRDVFEAVGGFDPDFFLFGEDLDLFYRVREKGWKIIYHPRMVIEHEKGTSMRKLGFLKSRYHFFRSMGIYYRKRRRGSGIGALWLPPILLGLFVLTLPVSYVRWRLGAGSLR